MAKVSDSKRTEVVVCPPRRMPPVVDKIVCGDNCDVLGRFPDACVDLVVTSPPYDDLRTYGGHAWDFYGVAWQLARVLKPGGVIVWVVADATKDGSETGTSMRQALHFQQLGLNLHDTMIYQQTGTGAKGSNLSYWQEWEYMFVISKGVPKTVNRLTFKRRHYQGGGERGGAGEKSLKIRKRPEKDTSVRSNVWRVSGDCLGLHPAPFPEQLAADHIKSWSNEGDLVVDPFNGSGTTTKMACILKRHYIGIEVNPEYAELAVRRMGEKGFFV